MRFQSSPLTARHDVDTFRSGQPALDLWLREQALRAQHQGSARTTVWTVDDEVGVRAYFSIAPTSVMRSGLPRRASDGVSVVPAYLLARLALDERLHGRGLGGELLVDALQTICDAASRAGGRLVVVDPIDDAARAFYRRFGFTDIEASGRQFQLISAVRVSLGLG